MTIGPKLLAATALLPAMIGPLPASATDMMTIALCGGGSLEIPLNHQEEGPPCAADACHAGNCRKTFDPSQRRGPDKQ